MGSLHNIQKGMQWDKSNSLSLYTDLITNIYRYETVMQFSLNAS